MIGAYLFQPSRVIDIGNESLHVESCGFRHLDHCVSRSDVAALYELKLLQRRHVVPVRLIRLHPSGDPTAKGPQPAAQVILALLPCLPIFALIRIDLLQREASVSEFQTVSQR